MSDLECWSCERAHCMFVRQHQTALVCMIYFSSSPFLLCARLCISVYVSAYSLCVSLPLSFLSLSGYTRG